MLLSVVTLNYKNSFLTINSIDSLFKQFKNEFDKNKLELIIIDNASGDESVKRIKEAVDKRNIKNVRIVENKENVGFSKGCNQGADISKGEYLLFLNNDTIIKDKGIMEMLSYFMDHKEISILGGRLTNTDGSEQPSVGKFYNLPNALILLLGVQRFGNFHNPSRIKEVDWVKGGLLMTKKDVFKKLGGFDENIFMYTEDMEFCYRAKKEGLKVYFYPNTNVEHVDQGSSSRTNAIVNIYQNLLYFYKKHKSPAEYSFLRIILRTKAIFLIGVGKMISNNYLTQTYEKALKVA